MDPGLHPDRHGYCANAATLAAEVGDRPSVLPLLQVLYNEAGQFPTSQCAADQEREEGVITFALQGRAVRDGQQLPGLLLGQPVSQPRFPSGADSGFRSASQPRACHSPRLGDQLAEAARRTLTGEGARSSMDTRYSLSSARVSGVPAAKANRRSRALA